MTVCIAAIADNHESVVSCVDTRISTPTTSFDPLVGRKLCGLRGWTILVSGTTSDAESLVDTVCALLSEAPDNDPPTVKNCLDRALRTEMPKYIAAKYLTPYGIDMPTFLDPGKRDSFTSERWNELSRLMLEYSDNYDVELLVSGWGAAQEAFGKDRAPEAHIYRVNRDGAQPHGGDGFITCGSGGPSAYSILSFFAQQPHMTVAETVYHVAAAKFMSEKAGGVGDRTGLRITKRIGSGAWSGYFIQPDETEALRRLWQRDGLPRMTAAAHDKTVEIIAHHEKSQHVTIDHMVRNVNRATRRSTSRKSEGQQ